jgi:hypothetical protein
MAYTSSVIFKSVYGNKRAVALSCTADAASGVIVTGLNNVEALEVVSVSMASGGTGNFRRNLTVASAAANGSVFVSSIANGDVFLLTVYGS